MTFAAKLAAMQSITTMGWPFGRRRRGPERRGGPGVLRPRAPGTAVHGTGVEGERKALRSRTGFAGVRAPPSSEALHPIPARYASLAHRIVASFPDGATASNKVHRLKKQPVPGTSGPALAYAHRASARPPGQVLAPGPLPLRPCPRLTRRSERGVPTEHVLFATIARCAMIKQHGTLPRCR